MTEKKLIQIVGKGCKKCERLHEEAIKAVAELGKTQEYEIQKITDIGKFADLDIFITPGLRINGKVVSEGRVLGAEKIKNHL
ncbi:MAG: thioredoxin family protein [Candidatus Heimdallarchaeaceae archaeon]